LSLVDAVTDKPTRVAAMLKTPPARPTRGVSGCQWRAHVMIFVWLSLAALARQAPQTDKQKSHGWSTRGFSIRQSTVPRQRQDLLCAQDASQISYNLSRLQSGGGDGKRITVLCFSLA